MADLSLEQKMYKMKLENTDLPESKETISDFWSCVKRIWSQFESALTGQTGKILSTKRIVTIKEDNYNE